MAWAHLAGAGNCHSADAPVVQMPADCPEHRDGAAPNKNPLPPSSMPCCGGGSCACAMPPSVAAPNPILQSSQSTLPAPEFPFAEPSSIFIDDAFRPPIH